MTDHVEVTGSGTHHVVPDLVIVRARVQCDARDVAGALAQAADRTAAAMQAATDHGIGDRDRRTDDVGIHPRYDQEGRKVIGYTAYQAFRLTVRERDRVGDLMQALAGAAGDALAIDGLEVTAELTPAAAEAAREAAFADALARATQFARLADSSLGRVLHIHEGRVIDGGPRPMMMAKMADLEAGSMPVEGGTQAVTTSVTVRWELA